MTLSSNVTSAPRETISLLRALVEQAPDLIVAIDHDFRLLICNAAYTEEMHRLYGEAPAVGDDVRAFLAHLPDQSGPAEQAWSQALAGREVTVTQTVGDPVHGQEVYELSYGPLHLGDQPAAFHIARRVTARVREEEQLQRRGAELEAKVAEQAAKLERAAEMLQERRARLAAALSVSDVGTFRHDVRTQLSSWDENLQHFFGVEPGEQLRSLGEFLQIVHPGDRASVQANMEPVAIRPGRRSGMFRIVQPGGEIRWLQYRAQVFSGEDGKPAYMIGACADVTPLKQAEHELKERERQLRELADYMPVIVWTQRPDASLEYVNRRWQDYTGLDLRASHAGGWRQVVHPDDLRSADAAVARARRHKEMFEVECRLRCVTDGAYRWHLVRSTPMLDPKGRVQRWYGTAVDIEERVQSEQRLEQIKADLQRVNSNLARSLAQFEGIIGSISDGLILFDAAGNRVVVNAAARRLHGIPPEADIRQTRSQNMADFDVRDLAGNPLPPEAWPSSRALKGEIFAGVEVRMRRIDNNVEWVASYSGAPVYDEHGRQIYAVITFRDVSERRAAEQALQTAVEARDRFLSIASHELRTPLTTLIMQLQMTRRRIDLETGKVPPPADLVKTLDIANRQATRLAKLVDELLDVSRSGLNRLEFNFQPTDLGQLTAETCGQYATALEQAHCPLVLSADAGVVGEWDTARLEQVIGTLLSNAIKYAAGTPVHVAVRRRNDQAVLTVRDHGPGIPPANRAKVFDRFERYVEDDAITGLGLGLFLAREIVRGHQGEIELTPIEGPGACFTVTLPLKPKEAKAPTAA
ncbi:MAG TPA: PAS domain S-box protein [Gammaproteobacteria bacterium]|nr:PAS domain S-box protein [Gammaproteobacteria bacterium]